MTRPIGKGHSIIRRCRLTVRLVDMTGRSMMRVAPGVTIGTRACTATMTLPRVSASSRLESWASRSCNPRQNSMRAVTDGGVSIEPKLAMLVANPAVLPAVLNQAHCQPIGRLAKVHEHCSGTIRARFLPSEAEPLLAAPASSWRTTCHSITSSARASSVGGTSRPSAWAVFRLMTSSYLVDACTGRSAGFSPRRTRST